MHEERLTAAEATDKVITENLHGLELDPRCTQIAAFNLALTAWKFIGYYKELPEMNLACSGIAPTGAGLSRRVRAAAVGVFADATLPARGTKMPGVLFLAMIRPGPRWFGCLPLRHCAP